MKNLPHSFIRSIRRLVFNRTLYYIQNSTHHTLSLLLLRILPSTFATFSVMMIRSSFLKTDLSLLTSPSRKTPPLSSPLPSSSRPTALQTRRSALTPEPPRRTPLSPLSSHSHHHHSFSSLSDISSAAKDLFRPRVSFRTRTRYPYTKARLGTKSARQ